MTDAVPDPVLATGTALQLAAQALVLDLFARIDAKDIDGAVALYAPDAVFLGATGRREIREVMLRGLAPNAGQRSRHVIGNVRSVLLDADSVLVKYTAVAYTLAGPGPFAARSIIDQEQVIRRGPGGELKVAEQRIPAFSLPAGNHPGSALAAAGDRQSTMTA